MGIESGCQDTKIPLYLNCEESGNGPTFGSIFNLGQGLGSFVDPNKIWVQLPVHQCDILGSKYPVRVGAFNIAAGRVGP